MKDAALLDPCGDAETICGLVVANNLAFKVSVYKFYDIHHLHGDTIRSKDFTE